MTASRRRLLTTLQDRGWPVRNLRPLSVASLIHQTFRATLARDGTELFVKVRNGPAGLAPDRYAALARSGIPMPAMYAAYRLDSGSTCEIYEFIPGDNAQRLWPKLDESARRLVARALGIFAVTLHELRPVPSGVPRLDLVPAMTELAEPLAGVIPRHPVWRVIEALPALSPPKRFCHGDLNVKNLIMTKAASVVLVDWEWAALAEPAYEFKNTRLAVDRGYRELRHVLESYDALTGRPIPRRRLLVADIYYTLVQLKLAHERGLADWQDFHKKRLTRLVRRYRTLD